MKWCCQLPIITNDVFWTCSLEPFVFTKYIMYSIVYGKVVDSLQVYIYIYIIYTYIYYLYLFFNIIFIF